MSGKPSPQGVAELWELIAAASALSNEVATLNSTILVASTRLRDASEEYTDTHRKIRDKMQQMDIASDGNAGWEGRLAWFLAQFYRHSKNIDPGRTMT
jgi:hypothetical protein